MKKRKELTPEQIAARDARRSKFRALARQVAQMSDAQRAELVARLPAVVTIEGRALSCFNSCLVAMQNPGASMVGGFKQWIAHGRAVKKGEHGAMIWVPCGAGRGESAPATPSGAAPNEDGEASGGVRFITATVFDVTQTQEIAGGERPQDVPEVEPARPKLTGATEADRAEALELCAMDA